MPTRSELLELFYAIASIANSSPNLEIFLSQIINPIALNFKSEFALLYLINDKNDEHPNEMKLCAYYGVQENSTKSIQYLPTTQRLIKTILISPRALAIQGFNQSHPAIKALKNFGAKSLIAKSLSNNQETEGLIILGKIEPQNYRDEEISLIELTTEEIAKVIQEKRSSQLAIELKERQRLLRDLHDSVSQKLYGLVALTEAARGGIETGSKIDISQILLRIEENARQAVKEMRLLLFQMQPVDLKDGLVSSLHHRLAAVEGRAAIKARLIADEEIDLPIDQQIGLYYIAQEALNNVLRHANARTVTVSIKKKKSKVILEIEDDGVGFKVDSVKQGLGLSSMRERARQLGSNLRIFSKPSEGTLIRLIVDNTRQPT